MKKGETPPAEPNAENTTAEGTPTTEGSSGPPAEATTTPAPVETAAPAEPEVPLISSHDLFRSMATPTQNAAAEAKTAEGTQTTEGSSGQQAEGTSITEGTTAPTTPGGQPATGTMGVHTSNVSATAAVGMFDFLFAIIIGMVFSKVISDDYRASDGEKNELAKALAPALAASNIVISPWYNVILVATAIYGPKAYKAYQNNEKQQQFEAYIAATKKAGGQPQQGDAKIVNMNPAAQQPNVPTNPAAQNFVVKAPEQPIINTGGLCQTCNASIAQGKRFCDRPCASRFEVDKKRIEKGLQPMYMGLPKAEADKVAKANAPKKPTKKTTKSK